MIMDNASKQICQNDLIFGVHQLEVLYIYFCSQFDQIGYSTKYAAI